MGIFPMQTPRRFHPVVLTVYHNRPYTPPDMPENIHHIQHPTGGRIIRLVGEESQKLVGEESQKAVEERLTELGLDKLKPLQSFGFFEATELRLAVEGFEYQNKLAAHLRRIEATDDGGVAVNQAIRKLLAVSTPSLLKLGKIGAEANVTVGDFYHLWAEDYQRIPGVDLLEATILHKLLYTRPESSQK